MLDGKKHGGLTFEELLSPIFARSFSDSKSIKGQKPGPEVQRDIDHKTGTQPNWPICNYSEWAAHEAEDNARWGIVWIDDWSIIMWCLTDEVALPLPKAAGISRRLRVTQSDPRADGLGCLCVDSVRYDRLIYLA